MTQASTQQSISPTSIRINSALDGGTLLNPITKADVAEVVKLLSALSPADAKAAIAQMARDGKLQIFAQELTDTTWLVGGLSQPEQAAFFADMARKLDAPSLSQLYGALVASDKSKSDYSAVYGVTEAISKQAAPNAQLEFLRANADRITKGEVLVTASIGGVTAQYGFDPTAYTSAILISKLPPAYVAPAIASLSDAQLAQLVRSGVAEQSFSSSVGAGSMGGASIQSWNPENLVGLLNNAKLMADPLQRTRLAVAATGEYFNMLNARSNFGLPIVGQAQSVGTLRNAIAGVTGRSDLPSEAAKAPPTDAELILDVTQMSLDIVGIFDQTGAADLVNGGISLGRGDLTGAVLSGLAVIPIVGALAAAGKLGRWGDTIIAVVNKAKNDPAFRAAIEPALLRIQAGFDMAGDQIAKLGDSAKATVATIRAKLDELLGVSVRGFSDGVKAAAERLGIPPEKVQSILDIKKPQSPSDMQRPDPTTYMSKQQITNHLAKFDDGAIRFTPRASAAKYGTLGPSGGFVMPASEFSELMKAAKGDLAVVETKLSLDAGTLTSGDTLIAYIERKDLDGLRIPSGNEGGVHETLWLPGGYTSGGIAEAVMDFSKTTPYQEIKL